MKLPYTEEESLAAYRGWKAMCGHHSIAAATGRPLEDVRTSGVKLCGWMNPSMISQCLRALKVSYNKVPVTQTTLQLFETLKQNQGSAVLRVQFLGPWMKGPAAAQYRRTHYIATGNDRVMDPALDTNVILDFSTWLAWAHGGYAEVCPGSCGFTFTHAWHLMHRAEA